MFLLGADLKAFLLMVALVIQTQSQESTDQADQQISDGISRVSISFHDRISQLQTGPSGIVAINGELSKGELNLALARTKLQLLKLLPDEATPIRNYIERHFPGPIKVAEPNGSVSGTTVNTAVSAADSLMNELKNANPYRLDLIVDSEPRDALFELQPRTGDSFTRGTRGLFTNVWRGEYTYSVSKAGQKTITGTVDLIREKGNALVCHFVPNSSPDDPLPCELTSARQ